ncbi:MAG: YitT family protein [Chitinophagaceae bacterium]|nr:YitT family protein [Chitinophagaceae bacterium]
MQPAAAQAFILDKLTHGLSASLYYHNVTHTERVMQHAALLAEAEGITGTDRDILLTAAAFHDAGFLEKHAGHEEVSCRLARECLPGFGFGENEISRICDLIMATKLPQTVSDRLSAILCDADLYYLGTDDYGKMADLLYREFLLADIVKNKMQWQRQQIDFLKAHQYFTKTAQQQLAAKQEKNLIVLQARTESPHTIRHHESTFSDIVLIIFGVVITSFALKGFLVPNHFFDGGITGISLLVHELYHFNLAYVIVLANIPFILISLFSINRGFAVKTFFCVVLLGIALLYEGFPVITDDKLLISIFGGFFLGLGIGLTMRAGCAVDGIEVLALYTLRRSSFTISEIILGLNIIIFSLAAFEFGIQTALYSMLTYFTASKTIDYVIEGLEAYTGVTIISGKSEEMKHRLVNELGRGITVYKGERGYLPGKFEVHDDCDIIFTIITRLEMRKLKNMVTEVDPNAFVFASTIKETSGGIIKRRHLH